MTDQHGTATDATAVSTPSDREIVAERIFDAPPERVFAAYTEPKLIPEWWGPRGVTTTVDKMDARPGGDWRFVCRDPDGETAFRGTYREITPTERVSETFEWEGMPSPPGAEGRAPPRFGTCSSNPRTSRTSVAAPGSRPRCSSIRPRSATACSRPAWKPA